MHKFLIRREKLGYMYLSQKKSSFQIAKFYRCSQTLIMQYLKKYEIPRRSIQEAKALTPPRYSRKDFRGSPSEKAYLIGFRLGDLYVSKTHPNSPTIRIGTNTTRREQINLIQQLFTPYGYVKTYARDTRGAHVVRAFVNNSFSFLLKKKDEIEKWISTRKQHFISFLGGYVDAEGTFCISGSDGVFGINSQDKNILWGIYRELTKMRILCKPPSIGRKSQTMDKRGIKNNRDVWMLRICRKESLLKLIDLLKSVIRHEKRYRDMLTVKRNIQSRNIKYGNRKDNRRHKTYTL